MRRPQSFTNHFGVFSYRYIKAALFQGFETVQIEEADFRCATPEKALLDHWYWGKGEWTTPRMREMRLQNIEQLDCKKLEAGALHTRKPRIIQACNTFLELARKEGL